MTPQEKAEELYNKMYDTQGPEYGITQYEAKQCALIAVDEIIKVLWYTHKNEIELRYWQAVKTEVEKL